MHITKLEASNVLRLSAVTITPEGNLVVIGGENAQGKSSVLNSIAMALAGDKFPKPLRDGAQKGKVEIDLGDFKVTRTFTHGGGGTLTVKNKEGVAFASPQTMLDKLIGKISFDPLAFTREKSAKQLEILRELAGIDTSAIDTEYQTAFDERTGINRDLKAQEARLAGITKQEAPETEVSISDLSALLTKAVDLNSSNAAQRAEIDRMSEEGKTKAAAIGRLDSEIKGRTLESDELRAAVFDEESRLKSLQNSLTVAQDNAASLEDVDTAEIQKQIEALQKSLNDAIAKNSSNASARAEVTRLAGMSKSVGESLDRLRKELTQSNAQIAAIDKTREEAASELADFRTAFNAKRAEVLELKDENTAAIREQMAQADEINSRVRSNRQHAEESAKLAALQKKSRALDSRLDVLKAEKHKLIRDAKYPLEGLSLSDDGIMFGGIPFSQASAAEQLRVSMSIALAMNPQLRVCLIRDGSLLDKKALEAVATMAKDSDAQVWIERVGEGKECQVVIEDGHVKEELL